MGGSQAKSTKGIREPRVKTNGFALITPFSSVLLQEDRNESEFESLVPASKSNESFGAGWHALGWFPIVSEEPVQCQRVDLVRDWAIVVEANCQFEVLFFIAEIGRAHV